MSRKTCSRSVRAGECVTALRVILAYLKDSYAAAHSVDSDIFQGSDSSICALQDLKGHSQL